MDEPKRFPTRQEAAMWVKEHTDHTLWNAGPHEAMVRVSPDGRVWRREYDGDMGWTWRQLHKVGY